MKLQLFEQQVPSRYALKDFLQTGHCFIGASSFPCPRKNLLMPFRIFVLCSSVSVRPFITTEAEHDLEQKTIPDLEELKRLFVVFTGSPQFPQDTVIDVVFLASLH
ncbi:MAG: hypothetical protein WC824_09015 [Bacteroidota bacterium]|jgi:hypothetical protein